MPTYVLRSGLAADRSSVAEHGATVWSETVSTITYHILTETRLRFTSVPAYTIGETVTEATSTETGVVYWVDTGTNMVGLVDVSGAFTGGEVITGGTSGANGTPDTVENLIEKTADTPTATHLTADPQDITSTGALDPQTVYLDAATRWVMIWKVSGANVSVYNIDTNTLLYPIPRNGYVSFRVDHTMQKLVLAFDAAGTCQVIESKEELPQ